MRLHSLATWIVAVSLAAFCQSPDPTLKSAVPPAGHFSNGTYLNPDLGITYTLPGDWRDSTDSSGSNLNPASGSRILLVADRSAALMSVDRIVFAAQSTEGITSDVQQFAEKFSKASTQRNNSELLRSGVVVDFGGLKFYRADLKESGLLSNIYRTHLCTEIQGYFLVWTFASLSDSRLDEMVNTLKDLSIAPEKRFRSRDIYPPPAVYEKDMRQWLLKRVPPVYSKEMMRDHTTGDVVLGLIVGPDGAVKKARLISGQTTLTEAATNAAMQWKYRPYLLDGKPVSAETEITIHFAPK